MFGIRYQMAIKDHLAMRTKTSPPAPKLIWAYKVTVHDIDMGVFRPVPFVCLITFKVGIICCQELIYNLYWDIGFSLFWNFFKDFYSFMIFNLTKELHGQKVAMMPSSTADFTAQDGLRVWVQVNLAIRLGTLAISEKFLIQIFFVVTS